MYLILGIGAAGYHAASQLRDSGRQITLVDIKPERIEDLKEMGFEGVIEGDILESLASSPEAYRLAKSMDEVQYIFELFAGSVTKVFTINYERNDQIIDPPKLIKFIFKQTKEHRY